MDINDYYKLLFQVSMNVPRIMGYILSYCYQNTIILDKKITKSDIEFASQRYFEENLWPFFENITYSTLTLNEKIPILQLKELLTLIVSQLSDIKKRITKNELKGEIYNPQQPFSSHFYFDPKYENVIQTLELNFFLSKYNDLSDKSGNKASIYCINYGLAKKNNLNWGKPEGGKYRKYFIERPFDFNNLIQDFLKKSKHIYCTNTSCGKHYPIEDLEKLEFAHFKCTECGGDVTIEDLLSKETSDELKIDQTQLLPQLDLKILHELAKKPEPIYARQIAEEIDYSSNVIAYRNKKMIESQLVERSSKRYPPYKYKITDKARDIYISRK